MERELLTVMKENEALRQNQHQQRQNEAAGSTLRGAASRPHAARVSSHISNQMGRAYEQASTHFSSGAAAGDASGYGNRIGASGAAALSQRDRRGAGSLGASALPPSFSRTHLARPPRQPLRATYRPPEMEAAGGVGGPQQYGSLSRAGGAAAGAFVRQTPNVHLSRSGSITINSAGTASRSLAAPRGGHASQSLARAPSPGVMRLQERMQKAKDTFAGFRAASPVLR